MIYIDDLFLLSGEDYKINEKLKVRHPTIRDILYIGERKYWEYINLFCLKPYDLMVQLHDLGIDYADVTDYDLFLLLYREYKDALKWLIGYDEFEMKLNTVNNERVLYDSENDVLIDRLIYEQISSFIRAINLISDKNEFNPGDETAKKMLIKQKRKELDRIKGKEQSFKSILGNQVSSVLLHKSNVFDMPIYELNNMIFRLRKRDNYTNLMFGIYTGNIDTKDIDMEDIDWMSGIKY